MLGDQKKIRETLRRSWDKASQWARIRSVLAWDDSDIAGFGPSVSLFKAPEVLWQADSRPQGFKNPQIIQAVQKAPYFHAMK